MNEIKKIAAAVKADSFRMACLSGEARNDALRAMAIALADNCDGIARANEADLDAGEKAGLAAPLLKRLKFDGEKIADVIAGTRDLIKLPDPVGRILLQRELDKGLILTRVSCPIGVIGVIFESRPDALVQIAALCLKSGNCAILKGGSEAKRTNRVLFEILHAAGTDAGVPAGFLTLLESRSDIDELLTCHESIDLIIPRGSNAFVRHIMDRSDIPVMGHSDGVCHVYVDRAADIGKAVAVIRDSKVQYPAACNAAETILVHADIAEALLPPLWDELKSKGVLMRGTPRIAGILPDVEPATEEDNRTEYLDFIVSLAVTDSIDEAIEHINTYGSHHTDCIVTEDEAAAERFLQLVDSAGVYQNCSTRFADGFRYGFGAEVGIGTGKLHARGPVGLEGLATYKYLLRGDGHIVADYAEGRRHFRFKDLR
ncbi:MAG: glutamate-5-semialdehyde dehydrogenase [Clostridiales Family XIII bacterium]|jgi:glutamate-5-semialdehyde dehydrogenase|nr:glutamate-5-semialdehyde dehydrogenase [Clostridiales Family XIII bacterium]